MDLRDYYDHHWTEIREGQVDYSRLQLILDRVKPGQYTLDAGCGPGFLAEKLKEKGVKVVATDLSKVGVQRTQRRGIPTQQADLDSEPLPFEDGTFEVVICNSNLEHLCRLERNVAECIRVLKPGGTFIWMEPNSAHIRYRLELLFGRFRAIPEAATDPYHVRHVTAHSLRALCEANGLVVKELIGHQGYWNVVYYSIVRMPIGWRVTRPIYDALLRRWPQVFSRYLLIRAEKPPRVAADRPLRRMSA